jgi:hypothetical protein
MQRVEALEIQVSPPGSVPVHVHTPKIGMWQGEDFSI